MNVIQFSNRKDNTTYTGRNGVGQCFGLDILITQNHVVLSPVNSKGQVANCEINIPLEDIMKVAKTLAGVSSCQ